MKWIAPGRFWWTKSNPDHVDLQIQVNDEKIAPGIRLEIEEYVAGFYGKGTGTITRVEPGQRIVWKSDGMTYRFYGIPMDCWDRWRNLL